MKTELILTHQSTTYKDVVAGSVINYDFIVDNIGDVTVFDPFALEIFVSNGSDVRPVYNTYFDGLSAEADPLIISREIYIPFDLTPGDWDIIVMIDGRSCDLSPF
jgi:hypothetical protein